MSGTDIERSGFGPVETLATYFNTTTLDTTPVSVTLPARPVLAGNTSAPPTQGNILVKIVNGSSSATIAWSLVDLTSPAQSAPAITAAFAATCASVILPSSTEWVVIPANRELYVVASAVSTSVHVSSWLFK